MTRPLSELINEPNLQAFIANGGVPVGTEGKYYINRSAEVFSTQLRRPLSQNCYKGRYCVTLHSSGKNRRIARYRLLLATFKPVEGWEKLDVDHMNGIKDDDRLENLRWCTKAENIRFEIEAGRFRKGERAWNAKLTQAQVDFIRKVCKPGCSTFGFMPLAKVFGVCNVVLAAAYKGESWRDSHENAK